MTEKNENLQNAAAKEEAVKKTKCSHAPVEIIREMMPCEETLYDVADLFKIFGDCTRIKILCALFESEMCVSHIAELLSMNQSAISHQLRVLKNARLVKIRRSGKEVFYSLADDHIKTIFNQGLEHINE
ncbi:MAG: metalloregulator ArsR/SmtB family transcription factor [Bacillota bacterium]|nr:metalloregulator ArsR/SmtB family transcription factor [Bacillota bacterium]